MYLYQPYSINATYGSHKTPCTLFVKPTRGGFWYAVENSSNVNFTYDEITEGCDIEELRDSDFFTWPDGISSEEELEEAVDA